MPHKAHGDMQQAKEWIRQDRRDLHERLRIVRAERDRLAYQSYLDPAFLSQYNQKQAEVEAMETKSEWMRQALQYATEHDHDLLPPHVEEQAGGQ